MEFRDEDRACLECALARPVYCDWEHNSAAAFFRLNGQAPCAYWRVRWERTGWLARERAERAAKVVDRYVHGVLGRRVDRAVAEVLGK